MYLKAEQNKCMCFYNNNHNSLWLYIAKKQSPGLRHTGIYLLSCMMILTTIHPLIHTFLTLPIVCRDRSLYLAVSALYCTLVIDGHVVLLFCSCRSLSNSWFQGLSGVKRTISVHVVIILWNCTKTITYCAGLYCGYFVDFVQQTKADFAV